MDFFARQDRALRQSRRLVFWFALAVLFTVVSLYLTCVGIFLHQRFADGFHPADLWHPSLALWVSVGTLSIIGLGSIFRMLDLRQGGGAVAQRLGGRLLESQTRDPDERRLLNIVEEMALASGMPVPEVYLLDDESGINAFAAGHTIQDAALGVTRGALRHLSRDELQGVIAHEFSHVFHGDMRLNLRLIGVIHGLLVLTILGRILLEASLRSRRSLGARGGKDGVNPLPILGVALMVVGAIGVFFGRIIKSGVSRQREFLADASAVQFTRNPEGISGALKKIGALSQGSRLQNPHAEEASHLLFGNGLASPWFGWLATHPPLVDRIRAIEPNFDGRFPTLRPRTPEPSAPVVSRAQTGRTADRLPGGLPPLLPLLATTGQPGPQHLRAVAEWRSLIPPELEANARNPHTAQALVFAVLHPVAPFPIPIRTLLAQSHEQPLIDLAEHLATQIATLSDRARLPIAEFALAALRQLSPDQYEQFRHTLDALVASDEQLDLFEFALLKVITRHLDPRFRRQTPTPIQFYALPPLLPDAALLLSAVAHLGTTTPEAIASAYQTGLQSLGGHPDQLPLRPLAETDLGQLSDALDKFAASLPILRQRLLHACAVCVAADAVVQPGEGELLRAIADTLDCPIPPFVQLDRPLPDPVTQT
jgi:Zn-dependent protease with chaperone function